MHELETGLRRGSQLLPASPSQGTCVLIRLASCHLASFSRALTGRKHCPGPDVTGGQPGPGLQLSGGGDRAVAGVGGGQEATRTWLFIQGAQQPQQSPFASQQRCQGESKDRRLKGVGGWVPKALGRVYSSGCLGRCTGRGTLSRQEEGWPSAKARGRSPVVLPLPAPAVGARGSWKEGGKSDRAGLMGAAGSSGP